MASAGNIRAGRAVVELSADSTALQRGLNLAQSKLKAFSSTVKSAGTALLAAGATVSAPIIAGVKSYADFEQTLAGIRASANPTAKEFDAIREAAIGLSKETGVAPNSIAQAFSELLKAGVSVEQVLGGAGEAAVRFARVGELETAEAAVTMADALKVFARDGLSASQVTDILSGAADSSSVSIRQITEAFQQTSASAGLAGQSLTDTATAIAMLGNEGIKGSDAGTSLKTALSRLMNPTKEAAAIMQQYGIEVRNADGSLKSLPEIAGQLKGALAGLNDEARQQAIAEIFGSDAMRTGAILLKYGTDGFNSLKTAITSALPVSSKFDIVMNTLWGRFEAFTSALARAGIAIGTALAPYVSMALDALSALASVIGGIVARYPAIASILAAAAIGLTVVGSVLLFAGVAAGGLAAAIGFAGVALAAILSPIGLIVAGIIALVGGVLYATGAFSYLANAFSAVWRGILASLQKGDVQMAFKLVMAEVAVAFYTLVNSLADAFAKLVASLIRGAFDARIAVQVQFGLMSQEEAKFATAFGNAAAGAVSSSIRNSANANVQAAQAARDALVNAATAGDQQQAGGFTGNGLIGKGLDMLRKGALGPAPQMPDPQEYGRQIAQATAGVIQGTFRAGDVNRLLQTQVSPSEKKQTELLQQIADNTSDMGPAFA